MVLKTYYSARGCPVTTTAKPRNSVARAVAIDDGIYSRATRCSSKRSLAKAAATTVGCASSTPADPPTPPLSATLESDALTTGWFPVTIATRTTRWRFSYIVSSCSEGAASPPDDGEAPAVPGVACARLVGARRLTVTGPAGTGKTTMLRVAYEALTAQRRRRSSGVAACCPSAGGPVSAVVVHRLTG